jgi:hypothetical protein
MMSAYTMGAYGQTGLKLLREIHLPTRSSRGSFVHFPIPDMAARDHFAMRIAPDQSILVFDSDTSGRWPLVRVRRWWTDNPINDVLDVPGWGVADAKYMDGIYVDVQVTPDGCYAIAFSKARWKDKSSFLLHAPKGYVARKPDTIISVIDLKRWEVLKSIHTADMGNVDVRNARVISDRWMAFDSIPGAPPSGHGVYAYLDQLISITDLTSGPSCVSQRFSHLWQIAPNALVQSTRIQNDTACGEVLSATHVESTDSLETLIQRDSGVEPRVMKLRDVSWKDDYLAGESHLSRSEEVRLWDAERQADEFFRSWGEYPYNDFYWQNPPFESSAHVWYGLYPHDLDLYELDRYDSAGKLQRTEVGGQLLCGDPSLGHEKSACGCRVIDVSEERDALLTYCRQQRGDFEGMVQQQWLAVFRSGDLSGVGLINLPKTSETLQAIASGNGHAYVVTLEFGEMLRVYEVPDPQ